MKILAVVTNTGARYEAGAPISEGGSPVKSITYRRNCYNNGHQGQFPVYEIRFEGMDIVQLINDRYAEIVVVDPEKDKKKDDVPELPDGGEENVG